MKDWKYFKYKEYVCRYTSIDVNYNIYENLEIWICEYNNWFKLIDKDLIVIEKLDIPIDKLEVFKIINNIQTRKED